MKQNLAKILKEAFGTMRIHGSDVGSDSPPSEDAKLWSIDPDVALYLAERITPDLKTIETGCGLTTVLFAAAETDHICIVPIKDEVERLKSYCRSRDIPLDRVRFILDKSESVLPGLPDAGFDLAIIDGQHAFPSPFIDFYYLAGRLKTGGTLVVDDVCLWTGKVLRDFLKMEQEWSEQAAFYNTAIFQKNAPGTFEKEWNQQPYIHSKSRWTVSAFHARNMARTSLGLLKNGDFRSFADKTLAKFGVLREK